jgi:hypothetical protein
MSWERRPREDEPRMIQRFVQDDQGRTWTGFVQSGRHEGGEDFAEVLFICNDQPAEVKRVVTLDTPPGEADDRWQMMADQEIEDLFKRSERA